MKKPVLNLLLLFCFISSIKAGEKEEMERLARRGAGVALVGAAVALVGLGAGVRLAEVRLKWGSLTIGVPAAAFDVPYTKENKELLEAAKDKNKAFIKEKLRALNKAIFGTTNYGQIRNILREFMRLEDASRKAIREQGALTEGVSRKNLKAAKNARKTFEKKYPPFKYKWDNRRYLHKNKWDSLKNLYGAVDAIYNRQGQYQRLMGLRRMQQAEFIALKEKLDKELGILD